MCLNILCCDVNHETHGSAVQALGVWHRAAMTRAIAIVLALTGAMTAEARAHAGHAGFSVRANDNTQPAGRSDDGTVTVRLRAARGDWHPEGEHGAALTIEAFGEEDRPASALLAVGETMDVDLDASVLPGVLWLEIRTSRGKWQAQGQVVLK
jgi:plasmid stability protein